MSLIKPPVAATDELESLDLLQETLAAGKNVP